MVELYLHHLNFRDNRPGFHEIQAEKKVRKNLPQWRYWYKGPFSLGLWMWIWSEMRFVDLVFRLRIELRIFKNQYKQISYPKTIKRYSRYILFNSRRSIYHLFVPVCIIETKYDKTKILRYSPSHPTDLIKQCYNSKYYLLYSRVTSNNRFIAF